MAYHYYATAQKATAVTACASGNFSCPEHLNLLLAKNTRIEIFLVGPEGLRLMKELNIHGKIVVMKLFRPLNYKKDLLFIVTAKYDAMILECEVNDDILDIHTKAHGNIADKIVDDSDTGIIAVIDPASKVIVLRIYSGLLKVIALEDGYELKATNIRIEEMDIQDINFLYGFPNPTLIFLHMDSNGRHIKTHELSLKEKEFIKSPWKQDNIEAEATMIISIPQPIGGAIVVGQETILYHDGTFFVAVGPPAIKNSFITCYARVDTSGCRHVLGDIAGNLFMLLLETEEKIDGTLGVRDIKLELLGEVSVPECITYLDNGVFFIGSRLGDSQLIKLNKVINSESGSYITVMDSFVNLAPIVDMVIVDLEGQGQEQLISCSGSGKEGSLKIVRSGITIQEQATIDLSGIKGIWALNIRSNSEFHDAIVLSFVGQSRILSLCGEDVEETEISGILTDQQTMFCGNVSNSIILQVVPSAVQLVALKPREGVIYEWRPPCGKSINVVAANTFQIVCALGCEVHYLEIIDDQIVEKMCCNMENEVSCLDINPLGETKEACFIALGLWNDMTVRILLVPTLEEVHKESIGGEIIPRSILFVKLEHTNYLFCGLGNGSLLYFIFNNNGGALSKMKKITLGTQPVILKNFHFLGTATVFACSDLPTVIYSSNHKLIFSNVNIKRINHMCPFNSQAFPDCLALVTDSIIVIGNMNEIQKLHIRSVPLGEAPKRLAYQRSSQTFGVLTMRVDTQEASGLSGRTDCASLRAQTVTHSTFSNSCIQRFTPPNEYGFEVYNFLLLDQHTFEVSHAYQMLPTEYCLSIISAKLGEDPTYYYILGTAFINPEDSEPKQGRIIMFAINEGKLNQVIDKEVKGACYSLCELNGKLLASINSTVRLFEWTKEKELRLECSHFNSIIALYLKTKGDFVLIGDIMRSMTVIQYKAVQGSFEEICRDYSPNWMTAIEILDDDTFLGAENSLNIFICQKDSASTNDEEREMVQEVSLFHLGDMVNVFRKGSLRGNHLGETSEYQGVTTLIGTINGAIGVLTQITKESYELLSDLQTKLTHLIKPVGKIDHTHWRSFCNTLKTEPPKGIIDGDLIECFLDLPRKEMMEAVEGIKIRKSPGLSEDASVDEMIKIVEGLSRIH